MTTDIVDISSTRLLTKTQNEADFCGNQRVHRELDTPTRERVITLASEPTIDYLSTKWYLYLLLLLARTTDHRLEICCSIQRTNWQLSVNNWHTRKRRGLYRHVCDSETLREGWRVRRERESGKNSSQWEKAHSTKGRLRKAPTAPLRQSRAVPVRRTEHK